MATLSSADTIQPDDKLVTVAVNLSIVVNVSAYEREYGMKAVMASLREDIRYSVLSSVEDSSDIFPVESGILVEASVR